MNKTLLACLAATVLCYSGVSFAQTQTQYQTQPPTQILKPLLPEVRSNMSLDDRFNQCLKDSACSAQTRMQIMQEENDEMNLRFQKIHLACLDMHFQNCVDPENETVQKWQTAHNRMRQLMQSMSASNLEKQEPAAGGYKKSTVPDAKEERRWDKIWWYKGKK
jgi:hypothetical protein